VTPTMLSRLYFPPVAETARLGWLERISDVSADTLVASGVRQEAAVQRAASADSSLISAIAQITAPVLVISASGDAVTPAGAGRVLADELPHATYVMIPNGGFACFSVAESAVTEALSSYVAVALTQ
jgi:pimeloyl-ACP methyl ester carboxylesterase